MYQNWRNRKTLNNQDYSKLGSTSHDVWGFNVSLFTHIMVVPEKVVHLHLQERNFLEGDANERAVQTKEYPTMM
jgi:hypothetical protein